MHRALSRALTAVLALPLLALLPVPTATAADATTGADAAGSGVTVAERRLAFDVMNGSDLDLLCGSDGEQHTLRGTLVGPKKAVNGRQPVLRVNLLLHDAGTAGWFWHLRDQPAYDYAGRLARAGETSLVLDRLGYGRSPLADGSATCLKAHAEMAHQLVQSLYTGTYRFADGGDSIQASHVVLHGHGTGATIAQLEAADHRDVQGVVLLSPVTASPSELALETAGDQTQACAAGATYAAFGDTDRRYRRLLFASATPAVRRAAVARRADTPCGDVTSLAASVTEANLAPQEGPVLQVFGSADRRRSGEVSAGKDGVVTTKVVKGAGNALPLEKQAPRVRALVLRFLGRLTGF